MCESTEKKSLKMQSSCTRLIFYTLCIHDATHAWTNWLLCDNKSIFNLNHSTVLWDGVLNNHSVCHENQCPGKEASW